VLGSSSLLRVDAATELLDFSFFFNLFMALRMVRLSLRYGLCAVSSFGMAMCAMMVGGASNDVALLVGMASCLSKCWTNTK
jgi:hypothetical protein